MRGLSPGLHEEGRRLDGTERERDRPSKSALTLLLLYPSLSVFSTASTPS